MSVVAPPRPAVQRPAPLAPAPPARRRRIGLRSRALLVLNVAVLAHLAVDGVWAAMAAATVVLLVVPGLLLLEAAGLPRARMLRFPPYLPAASVVVLAAAAVLANFGGPAIGVDGPLDGYPLLIALDAVLVSCCLIASRRAPQPPVSAAGLLAALPRVRDAWPLLPVALVVAGALVTPGDNRLPLVALVAALATLAAGLLLAGRGQPTRAAIALFGASLTFVYSYTLPGSTVFGWDITGEYATLTELLRTGHWPRLHPDDAYGAMLSLTLIPASLHGLAGLSAAVILKAVYPALLAMFPVCVFLIARRVVSLRAAYVAGLVIVAQAAFIQQLPAIARQEMALLMFAALLAALTDRHLVNGTRRTLLLVFGIGLVVSHYSTAYTTIGLLAIGVLVAIVLTCIRRRVRLLPSAAFALAVVAGAAAVWYGPVTHSYSNAGLALSAVARDGLKLLPGAEGKSPIDAYLQGNTGSSLTAAAYTDAVQARYAKERPYVVPLPVGTDARYALRNDVVPARGDQATGRRLWLADTVLLQLVNLLGALGGIALALRRRSSPVARLVGALAVGALAVLAVARLSGTIATTYNLERLSVQSLAVTGVGLGFLLDGIRRRNVVGRFATGAFAAGLLLVVVTASGLATVVTGSRDAANLYRSGEDYERFSISPGEEAAARWLGANAPAGAQIYADRYAQLRLFAFARRGTSFLNAVTPRTLDQHAWVYASRSNWVDGRARDAIGRDLVSFGFPRRYLDDHYDRWYVSGQGAVYRR